MSASMANPRRAPVGLLRSNDARGDMMAIPAMLSELFDALRRKVDADKRPARVVPEPSWWHRSRAASRPQAVIEDTRFRRIDGKFDALSRAMDQRFDALNHEMGQRFDALGRMIDDRFATT